MVLFIYLKKTNEQFKMNENHKPKILGPCLLFFILLFCWQLPQLCQSQISNNAQKNAAGQSSLNLQSIKSSAELNRSKFGLFCEILTFQFFNE